MLINSLKYFELKLLVFATSKPKTFQKRLHTTILKS